MDRHFLTRDRKTERRDSIILAAHEVFTKKGFHQAKMEEIAKKAGVGKGTLYEYFESKKDLFCGMVKQWMIWYFDTIGQAALEGEDFKQKLNNMMTAHMEFALRSQNLINMMLNDYIHISRDLNRWMIDSRTDVVNLVETVMKQGVREGKLRNVNVRLASLVYLSTWTIFIFENCIERGKSDICQTRTHVMDILLNGIAREDNPV
jgi:AcrR family transcriptional regulator